MLRKLDEVAFSIMPSRLSSRASGSDYRIPLGGTSIAGAEMACRRQSFENDRFTVAASIRDYRNQLIKNFFGLRRLGLNQLRHQQLGSEPAVSSVDDGAVIPKTRESLQVHSESIC